MRIAVFTTDDFLPPAGGAELALGEIIQRLPDVHFDIFCANLFKGRPLVQEVGNATIYRLGLAISPLAKLALVFLGPRKAIKLHKQKPYDAIWAMMASWGGLAAVTMKEKTDLPYLLTLQEGDSLEEIEGKTQKIRSRFVKIFSLADGLQPISHFLSAWGHRMGFHGRCERLVPNGVDLEKFKTTFSLDELETQRRSFGFPESAFILSTASRLVKKNGIGDVIEALARLPKEVCFVICGFGTLEEGLKARVKELGLEDRVRFLGLVTHKDLPRVLHATDAFIRPSLTEGLGNAFLEAMASGLPTIGTLVGGIPDFLEDGVTGFACKPSDPESIVATVERILRLSKEERLAVRDRAQEMIRTKYNWNTIARDMNLLFQELVHPVKES